MQKYPAAESHVTGHNQSLASLNSDHKRIAELESRVAELEGQLAASTQHKRTIDTRLNSLLAIGAALLITHEIEPVLDLIIRESCTLFPGTDGVLVLLHDPETQRLMLRVNTQGNIVECVLSNSTEEGINPAFRTPRSMLIPGVELEGIFQELQTEGNICLRDILHPWPPGSVLLAPLRDEDQQMGALILYRSTAQEKYHAHELPFIQALADLAAVAITETYQRAYAAALQRDLAKTQFLHREAQARLDTAQAQLLQSAKLAAVGELAASVAHEINNPLYAARNSLYLVEQELQPDEHSIQRQFLDIAQSELGRIASIITRMREFYRPSRAELSATDVNSLLRDTVEFVQTYLRHSAITVVSDLVPDLPTMIAHVDQLRQVFLNLVLNACDAMPNGGTLRVTTEILPPTDDQLAAIVIRISDTGTGIPDEHMAHLFEPFYTTKPQGTGLGLAISAHIVTQHAGSITVDSTVGTGTTFTVTFPITDRAELFDD